MEYLSRSRLPVFTPRLDLTAEDLNAEAETLCAAINELAGRLFIIKDMIPKEERAQYAEEESYPILDEIERIWEDIQKAWDTITKNKKECEEHYIDTLEKIKELDTRLNNLIQRVKEELLGVIDTVDKKHDTEEKRIETKFNNNLADLERRLNTLDDVAARKSDLAKLLDRVNTIQESSLPVIGDDGYWYLGNIKTETKAQGDAGEGVPDGGKAGYILTKFSDADHDSGWVPSNDARIWEGTYEEYMANKETIDAIYSMIVLEDPKALVSKTINSDKQEVTPTTTMEFTTINNELTVKIVNEIHTAEDGTEYTVRSIITNNMETPVTLHNYIVNQTDAEESYGGPVFVYEFADTPAILQPGTFIMLSHDDVVFTDLPSGSYLKVSLDVEVYE